MPLIYVPLEAVASKWYGESERNLAEIFKAAEQLGGAIIFLDEIDSLATQRRCVSLHTGHDSPHGRPCGAAGQRDSDLDSPQDRWAALRLGKAPGNSLSASRRWMIDLHVEKLKQCASFLGWCCAR